MTALERIAGEIGSLPQHVLLGLSGGADSVALLLILLEKRRNEGIAVFAVHVNHGLRGEASDGDEAFVRKLCEREGVPLTVFSAQPPRDPGEDWAREARYGFFAQAMAQSGADALALAHHRDDQAETLLLRLMRGAGIDGLGGMAGETVERGMRILRPLLSMSRQELRQLLRECGQEWREDASNGDRRYLRNAVRAELLPLMEQLQPGCTARMAAAAADLRSAGTRMAKETDRFLAENAGPDWLLAEPLLAQDEYMRRQILRAWWTGRVGRTMDERSLSRAQTEALSALVCAENGARCSLPGRWTGARGWHCLHLIPPTGPAAYALRLQTQASHGEDGDGLRCLEMPRALFALCQVRARRRGDWIRPRGGNGRQSLQDHLVNRRVDAPFRDRLPLLCRGSEVLWAAGVSVGDVPAFDKEQDNIRLLWTGTMPWNMGAKGEEP